MIVDAKTGEAYSIWPNHISLIGFCPHLSAPFGEVRQNTTSRLLCCHCQPPVNPVGSVKGRYVWRDLYRSAIENSEVGTWSLNSAKRAHITSLRDLLSNIEGRMLTHQDILVHHGLWIQISSKLKLAIDDERRRRGLSEARGGRLSRPLGRDGLGLLDEADPLDETDPLDEADSLDGADPLTDLLPSYDGTDPLIDLLIISPLHFEDQDDDHCVASPGLNNYGDEHSHQPYREPQWSFQDPGYPFCFPSTS